METNFVNVTLVLCTLCFQILALRLLQAVLPSWDKMERSQDMKFLVEKLFNFLGSLLSTCSSDLPLLRGMVINHTVALNVNLMFVFVFLYVFNSFNSLSSSAQRVPCEGGSPALRHLLQPLTAAHWLRRLLLSCALCTLLASGTA